MRTRWILLALVAILLIGAALFRFARPVVVETAAIESGSAVEVIYATGFVEVEEPVEVAARVTAPVTEVLAREGERVSAGQVLARLDSADQNAQIAQLLAQRRAAALDAERTLALHRKGFASGAARDRVRTALAAARAAERAARDRLNNFVTRAGVNGVVLRRDVEPGDMASPARTLFVIGDPARLKITATVDERDIPRVRVGQRALMSSDAYPGRVFDALVREITLGGDPNQRAFRVRLKPVGNEPLPIGLTLEVNIIIREKAGVILAPAAAIKDDHVWRAVEGRAERTEVETGISGPELIEVSAGLAVGDTVILNAPDTLSDGARIRADD